VSTPGKLTPKERRFVNYYVGKANWNATKAARMAGYAQESYAYLRTIAYKLLQKKVLDAETMETREILARLAFIARGDIGDLITLIKAPDGTPVDWRFDIIKAKQLNKTKHIKKVKMSPRGNVEIELYSPIDALEKLGRYRGLWKTVITVEDEPIQTEYPQPEPGPPRPDGSD
jgi:phage terminase small subunit